VARDIPTAQEQETQRKLKPQVTQRQRPFRFRSRVPYDVDTGITETVAGIAGRARSQNEKDKRTQEGLLKASVYNKLNTAKKLGLNSVLTADKANAKKEFDKESGKYKDFVERTVDSLPKEALEVVRPIIQTQQNEFLTTGSFHVAKETDIMAKNEHNALVAGKMEDVIRSVGAANFKSSAKLYNDSNYARYINALKGTGVDVDGVGEALNNRIEYFGMGKEEAEQFREQYISGTHIGAIENLIGKKKVEEARFIFVKNRNDIDPTKHDDIERMLEAAEENLEADTGLRIAREALKLPLKEQAELIAKKTGNDQSLLNHVTRSMNILKAEQKEIKRVGIDNRMTSMMKAVNIGLSNKVPKAQIMNSFENEMSTNTDLPYRERMQLRSWFEKRMSGKKITTNPKFHKYLMDLYRFNEDAFADLNLEESAIAMQLSEGAHNAVRALQRGLYVARKSNHGQFYKDSVMRIQDMDISEEAKANLYHGLEKAARSGQWEKTEGMQDTAGRLDYLEGKQQWTLTKFLARTKAFFTGDETQHEELERIAATGKLANDAPTVDRYFKEGMGDEILDLKDRYEKMYKRTLSWAEVEKLLNEARLRQTLQR